MQAGFSWARQQGVSRLSCSVRDFLAPVKLCGSSLSPESTAI
jgi:hypothetical protein